jgi:uncharacterized repeat protein (TIGR01451 family)/fimbrial isopeptide formation D2 family protein
VLRFWSTILLLCIGLFAFQGIALAAAVPSATLSVPTNVAIGANFNFTATFDSAGTTGYGPFIDLVFPATGVDGNDGITFTGATYLGQPVAAVQLTFPAGGCVAHPYAEDISHAPLQVCGTPGDTLVVLQLPFGSFTAGQPPIAVTVGAAISNLADLNTPLTIRARSGFQYGNDALDNPCCDPSLVNPPGTNSATWPGSPVTPTLISLTKTYLGPESETSTGPNFPRQYRIDVDIAPGQTIANLDVTDLLPDNVAFLNVVASSPAGATVTSTPTVGAAANPPNNRLTLRFPSVTGGAGTSDASVTFQFFVPLNDANGNPVIAAATGDDMPAQNNARAQGTWTPIDVRDPSSPGNALADGVGPEHTLTGKSIAVQKGVAIVGDAGMAGYSVGDTLEYTIQFQVSDYFAFQNVVVDDTLSDGQRYDATFPPTLSVNGNGFTLPAAAMSGANFTVAPNYTPADPAPNDGTTALQFRVSNELLTRGRPNGRWIGGCVPILGTGGPAPDCTVYDDGATTGTLRFRTVIQDRFTDTFPSGDPYVNSGDRLDNNVTISGDLLAVADTNTTTGFSEADTSVTLVNIVFGDLSKTVYAINGSTSFVTPVQVSPDDTVTYRIQYDLASSDFENLQFVDNLPLPIFSATELTIFDSVFDVTGAAPAAGHYKLGPADTYHTRPGAVAPTLTTNATDNSATFSYGTYNDPGNQPSAIDILFTVTVSDQPFADGLFLTNQVHETDGSTNGPPHEDDAIVQIQLTEPALQIKKGAIGSNHAGATLTPPTAGPVAFSPPGSGGTRWAGTINSTNLAATPVDSNISGVDSGDLVSFAIVVENTGSSQKGAFDLTITDTIPLGLIIPPAGAGLNMRVTYGDGTPLAFVGLTNGAGAAQDIFTSGIRLNDPALVGACQKYDPTNGRNIIIITYDLQVDPSAPAGTIIPNRASITNYAGAEGGPNFVPQDHPTDIATTTIASPDLAKRLTGTSIVSASNSNTQAVIGELATYTLTITVPEGLTSNAQIVDTLDSGLAFVDLTSVTSSAGLSMSTPIGVGASPANVTVGAGGRPITFSPGTITNSNTSDAQVETITITYRAVVLDIAGNQAGTLLNNSAVLSWANGTRPAVSAANVTVIEPTLAIAKSAAPTTGDAGDTITFDLTVANTAAGTTDAFEVALNDLVPAGMTYVSGSLINVSGPAATLNDSGAPTLTATWATLAPGSTSVIRFQATLDGNVAPGQSIINNATVQWTSLSGAPGQRSTYNTSSTERSGAGGVDDYIVGDPATVTINSVVPTKSLVTTSEVHTSEAASPPRVAIGEIVRYRLAVQLPEGAAPDIQIVDSLPTGLTFLNDGTARVAFVSNGGGITSASAQSGAIPAVVCTNDNGNAATLAALPQAQIDCTLLGANISTNPTNDTDVYNSGTDVRFKLGTLTNADSDADAEFVVVEFNALVDNSAAGSNDAGDNRDNTVAVFLNSTAPNGPSSNTIRVRVVEPSIPFGAATNNKTVVPTSGDAGDTVTYTVVYTNANGANNTDAFEVRVVDVVPAAATLNVGSISVTASVPCASPTFTNGSAGNTVDITLSRVAPNCRITITYQATLTTSVTPGQLIVNTANLTYTSLPGPNGTTSNGTGSSTPGAPGTNTGERNGSGVAPNDYLGNDTAQVTVFVPAPQKSLVATSEAHTNGSNLALGEIARYRMVVRVAEGASPNFQLRDTLPAGLTFLNDGTARAALVSNDPGLTSSTLSGLGLLATGDETTVGGVTPSFVLPAGAISGGTGAGGVFQNGDDPLFSLGSLSNTDSDVNQELVVIEFNALAGNVLGNQAGTALDNTFDVLVNSSLIATSNTVNASVVEPSIADLAKTVTTTPSDAGDTVVYQLTYSNGATGASRANAFDMALIDTLDSNLNLLSVSVTTPAGSNAADTSTLGVGGVVRVSVDQLPPAIDIPGPVKSVTIIVTAQVVGSTPNGLTIPNSADLTYTSLPGANGTAGNSTGSGTPGGSGANDGERNGSGGVNDYADSSSVSVTLATPTVQKLAPALTSYTIGEAVTYDIRVTLPEGATQALQVIDTLPAGLGYVGHSVVATAAASGGNLAADYNGALSAPSFTNVGGVLTFDFGAAQTNGSGPANGASNNQFLVRVVARVLNVAGNHQGATLVNSASLSYTNPNSGSTITVSGGSQTISLVEPTLTIDKRVTAPSANIGDLVTFQIAITNTSAVAAYDVLITDMVPAGLTYDPGSIAVVSGPAGTTDDSGAPNLAWNFAGIPAGATAVVAFDARIDGTGPTSIDNTAYVTWTSTPGSNPDERTGAGGPFDEYGDSDSTTLETASYILDKRLVAPADGLAGVNDTVRFSITVTNTGATLLATVPLTDSFDPIFLQFLNASTAPDTTAPGQLTWNNVGPLAVGATRTILIDFRTLAATDSQPGRVTVNRTGISDAQDSNGTTLIAHSSSAPVTIGAPDLHVAKSDGRTSAAPGDTLTYTIFVTNTGTYTATGVIITETLSLNTSFVGGSVAWVAQGGGVYTYALPSPLGIGQSASVTFVVTVDNPLPAGANTVTNTVGGGDDGTRGPDPTPADNSDNDVDVVNAAPDLLIGKTDGGIITTPGGTITYTLTYTNAGNQDATGVVITETVPTNTLFDASASTAGWSCSTGAPAGTPCTFTIGNLAASASGSATFAVTVVNPLPAGVSQVANTAVIGDDGSNGADPTPSDNTGSDDTPVSATSDLAITKSDGGAITTPGGVVAYTLTYTNTGDQDASGVTITETVPANTAFDAAASTAGWACAPNTAAGSTCTLSVGTVAGGGSGSATFAVTVANPLPAGVSQVANTAVIGDDGSNGADPTPSDNTGSDTTPVTAAPDLQLSKMDSGITVLPGAPITYTLTYTNVGVIAATGVVITETVPANSTFDAAGSTIGWSCANSAPAGTICTKAIPGAVAGGGGRGSVRFVVTVDNPLPSGVTQISNTAVIGDDGANGADPTPNNNIGNAATQLNPTAIALVSFTATPEGDTIVVRWVTSAELNTWGFHLYRSADGRREHAVRVTPQLILGTGRGQGASYVWTDTTAEAGVSYTYWLHEVEVSGATNEYGPASAARGPAADGYRVFIPFVH